MGVHSAVRIAAANSTIAALGVVLVLRPGRAGNHAELALDHDASHFAEHVVED